MIGKTISHYKVLEKLGEGSMGQVYRAHDTRLDRPVAIKLLTEGVVHDQRSHRRFQREVRALAALSHPSILAIHDFGEEGGVWFAVMELLAGETLRDRLRGGLITRRKAVDYSTEVAHGLAAAHGKGIVHRDLKPENIFVVKEGRIKILDFGIARVKGLDQITHETVVTQSGVVDTRPGAILGTAGYMSPEQVLGQEADHRSDIFSLGVILYEMLSGRRAFNKTSLIETMNATLTLDPPELAGTTSDSWSPLNKIVRRCLEKRPEERFQSAKDLAFALESISDLEWITDEHSPAPAGEEPLSRKADTHGISIEKSVAVLPFANMSPDPESEYFSDGVSEEIINALSQVQNLRVAARTSSFSFKGKSPDIVEVGAKLHVGTVLEGGIRKAGTRVRVTAQLINAANGYHIWSERYDREMEDIFAIQDEIAQNIVSALKVTLSHGEERSIQRTPTSNVRAYEYYLRGRKFFETRKKNDLQFALKMYSRAIDLDPSFALAQVGLTECWAHICMSDDRSEANETRALVAGQRAIELDPDLAEAHSAYGLALSWCRRRDEAAVEFEVATRLNPRLFEAYYFYALDRWALNECEKAIGLFLRAHDVHPEDYQAPLLLSQLHGATGRQGEAERAAAQGVEIARKHLDLNPDNVRALSLGAAALVVLSRREEGLAWVQQALALDPEGAWTLFNAACAYSLAGDPENALAALEKLFQVGTVAREWLEIDNYLDPLRSHARFQALLRRAR